jgi:hypothetical protein
MSLNFLTLCNQTLRRLNEVEISAADFPNTRGVQALVKDAVRSSIATIHQAQFNWPFNAMEHTQQLVVGQTEYPLSFSFRSIDWNSFQIIPSTGTVTSNQRLNYIERDEWYRKQRDRDDDAVGVGLGIPTSVFRAHGQGFGVTPSPDKAYTIQFRYFKSFDNLNTATDTTSIPSEFAHVIVDGAMYHMYMFKDNIEMAGVTLQIFQQGMKHLRTIFVNEFDSVYDRRVNFGGGIHRNIFP